MPIFANPKSAILNPDKLINKKIYENEIARVRSGTPSASSKVDSETFDSLIDILENVKIELIKINENVSLIQDFTIEQYTKLSYGNVLNEILKAKKLIKKVLSPSITTTELIKLQDITEELVKLYSQMNSDYEYLQEQEKEEPDENLSEEEQATKTKELKKVVSFFKQLIPPLQVLMNLLNSKLVSAGNDSNPKIQPEISGINAPPAPPDEPLEGAGFRTSWRLEKGAQQYQNQKYI
jgi:hypothetical protein